MPADRTLHNLSREHLLGIYEDLQTEPSSKKYNLRKELQTDKRDNVIYANRWVTRDQFLEMARQEIQARGLELPAVAPDARGGVEADATAGADTEPAPLTTPSDADGAAATPPQAPEAGVTQGAVAEGIASASDTAGS
jgi:hypothetical protein